MQTPTTKRGSPPVNIDDKNDAHDQSKLSRRRFLAKALLCCGALGAGDLWYERTTLDITHHRLALRGLRQPCRLIQLSDLHRSWCVPEAFIANIVARTNQLKPDLVLLTGDFVTNDSHYIESCANQIRRLHAPLGLYGVLGNHDYRCDHWHGSPVVVEGLAAVNVEMLTNRSTRLDNGLRLVGVDDFRTGHPDPEAAFRGVRPDEPTIAMTHNPFMFGAMSAYDCVTLVGHTHGGQVNVPIVTPFLLKWRMRYQRGWYQERTGPGKMYVSRGLGVVGVPFRFGSLPEIAVFDLIPG
jgi:predicted MPP superfamily phosphohydrolase